MTGGLMSHVTTFSLNTIGSIWLKQAWKCAKCWKCKKDWNQFMISWILGSRILCPAFLFMQLHLVSPDDVNDLSGYLSRYKRKMQFASLQRDCWTNVLTLAAIWAQCGFSMEAIWLQSGGFVRQQPNLSLNRRCGQKKKKNGHLIQTRMLSRLMWHPPGV